MKRYIVIIFCILITQLAFAQTDADNEDTTSENTPKGLNLNNEYIETAKAFLEKMSEVYASVDDVKAHIQIKTSSDSEGTIFVKSPNYMRINFTNPRGQVINNNGEEFYIYVPKQNVALHQKKKAISDTSANAFLTQTGLNLLSKNYYVSYFDKPVFIRFEEDPRIEVIKLRLTWRNTSQNFRQLILFVGKDYLIHKVEAITYNREAVAFNFSDFEINGGIPLSRFEYDPPPTAHVIDDFLFKSD